MQEQDWSFELLKTPRVSDGCVAVDSCFVVKYPKYDYYMADKAWFFSNSSIGYALS